MKTTALFPGTFDPFTIGHYSLVKRGLLLADELIIAIGVNDDKKAYYPLQERMDYLEKLYAAEPRVSVKAYSSLTFDFAREKGAAFILRGARSTGDFEYEKSMADFNRALSGIETVILFTEPQYAHISSTFVRELLRRGQSIAPFVLPLENNPLFNSYINQNEQTTPLFSPVDGIYLPGCRAAFAGGSKKTFHRFIRRILALCRFRRQR